MNNSKFTIGRNSHVAVTLSTNSLSGTVTPDALFTLGDVVRHRLFDFRGVVFDVDPEFANSEEWYDSIPEEMRPSRNQPFYHLFAENEESSYVAYVSQQNLVRDAESGPVSHPGIEAMFDDFTGERYNMRRERRH
jgi:heat shock protein HspQ